MPNFKPKTAKKIRVSKKNSSTLDGKHKDFMHDFAKDENNRIPHLKKDREELREKLKNEENTLKIEQKMETIDQINDITKKIKELKIKKKEYLLDNSKYIFDYFENKKNIASGNSNIIQSQNSKTKLVNNFFKIKEDISLNNPSSNLANNNIVQKYLTNIDDTFIDVNSFICQADVCEHCHKGELIPIEDEGILICNICARNVPYLIENEKPSYKEPPKEVCFYAYKRINHFKEILAQFQGKETTQIPPDVIENIKIQIKKERIELHQINNSKTKEILKKLGYNKYYEHISFIKDKLGIKPPIMRPELEETLCNLFIELQAPYSKFCPDNRVNFLNYYYTAYKLCELLGETQYLELFPLLKDREKRMEQDSIWKCICEEMDWEFIATI